MFCRNCGVKLNPGSQFCPSCGTKVENANSNNGENKEPASNTDTNTNLNNNTNTNTNNFNNLSTDPITFNSNQTATNADSTKLIRILAYLGFLFIVGLVCQEKNDPNVRFHTGQGMILFIAEVVVSVSSTILSFVFFGLGSLISTIGSILCIILLIIGIMNAVKNENKPLPIIGSLAFYK